MHKTLIASFASPNCIRLFLSSSAAVALWSPQATTAAEPKRVVFVTVTTGFRHSSIATAEATLQKLADQSKWFTVADFVRQPAVVVPRKPTKPAAPKPDADEKAQQKYAAGLKQYEREISKWTPEFEARAEELHQQFLEELKQSLSQLSPENLKAAKIDGVIFANTTGDLPLPDKDGFLKWVEEGHCFMAMHSASDTLHGFLGYRGMLRGEFAGHGAQVPADLIAADKAHPANGGIGDAWELNQEEMYLIKNQDRTRLRALWYLKHHPNKEEETGYFPVS